MLSHYLLQFSLLKSFIGVFHHHLSFSLSTFALIGLSQEKVAAFVKRLQAEPRYLLAQNVSTCIDPLEVCLHRQTVQDTQHIFQHSIPTEGKPVTNQKNSGRIYYSPVHKCPYLKSSFPVENNTIHRHWQGCSPLCVGLLPLDIYCVNKQRLISQQSHAWP